MKSVELRSRSDLHISRKVWHCTGVLLIAFIYQKVTHSTAVQIMTLSTALFVIVDVLRQQLPTLNNLIMNFLAPIMRDNEKSQLAGTTYLLLGVLIIMLIFPKPVVVLTLVLLAIADPVASYVGIRYGKDKIWRKKSLQGSLAAFVVCAWISGMYFYATNAMVERLVIVSLLTGLVGSLAELVPIGNLDDNLTFPLICSVGVWGIYYLFAGV